MPGIVPREAGKAGDGRSNDSNDDAAGAMRRALHGRPLRRLCLLLGATALWPATTMAAQQALAIPGISVSMGTRDVIQLAVFVGVTGAAIISAIWLIRERGRTASENMELRGRVADLDSRLQRSDALLNLKDQRSIVWMKGSSRPELVGALPAGSGAPEDRGAFLAFGRWLEARSAAALEHALDGLRENGHVFDLVIETQSGALLEAQGRTSPTGRVLRFAALSASERAHARLRMEHQRLSAERDILLGLAEALPLPVWVRDGEGKLAWVNSAYAKAVEGGTREAAARQGREFLSSQSREAIVRHQKSQPAFSQKLSTVVAGDRRVYDVTDFAGAEGSAGIAVDLTDVEAVREEYERTVRSHAATLDQLNTAVAIFDETKKLRFFNQAFQELWGLDIAYLESAPDHALLLDRLRSEDKLAERPDWQRWREGLLGAYRTVDSQEDWWHLPDGRTLRVVATPQPRGGVIWVFEDQTEKIDLETRFNSAMRVQDVTLDNLAEGVVVFGSDGRLRLSNPAFATLWGIDKDLVRPDTHISSIRVFCQNAAVENPWPGFVAAATGFEEERRDRHGLIELRDGIVLRYAVIYLPNGQMMITFVDVTDSVNVERALKEKNEALQRADQLKNDFVQHVSYELRSPLTNIIGFTELLGLGQFGPLTPRQREYVDHIGTSSAVLLTIVNDILDLATVDAGIMKLDIGDVPVTGTVEAAAELVADRFRDHNIALRLDTAEAPASFRADEHRVRQILFNLLSNAANFAPEGSTVTLAARPWSGGVEFVVHDDGPGMTAEMLDTVFRRFEPRPNGGRRRGPGLGLSIVKSFVELHGGTVEIRTDSGAGTTVICRFPPSPDGFPASPDGGFRAAAE